MHEDNVNELNPQAVIMAKAMKYAVENLNLTFKYKAVFNKKLVSKDLSCINVMSNYSVFGIGPMHPRDTNHLLEADGTFVSYYSSHDNFLDSESPVFRVTPNDTFRVRAILDIVRKLNWKFVSVISSYGSNGRRAAQYFIDRLDDADSCLDRHLELPLKRKTEKFKQIGELESNAIICFTVGQDTVNVIRQLNTFTKKLPQLLFAFGSINYDEIGKKTIGHGTLFN